MGSNIDQGSAYVFVRSGSGWSEQAKLIAADGAATDWFGCSVALDGDSAVVGAYGDDVGGSIDRGAAYVFLRSGTVERAGQADRRRRRRRRRVRPRRRYRRRQRPGRGTGG